jgi:hypothetical protein
MRKVEELADGGYINYFGMDDLTRGSTGWGEQYNRAAMKLLPVHSIGRALLAGDHQVRGEGREKREERREKRGERRECIPSVEP